MRSKRGVLLTELKLKELHLIPFDMDQEEVGFLFRQYGLVSAPVVDANRRLLGVITVDDVVHVIEEEAEEDLLKLGGVPEADIFARPAEPACARALAAGQPRHRDAGASVIAQFEATIAQMVIARGAHAGGRLAGRQRRHPGAHGHRARARARADHPRPIRLRMLLKELLDGAA